MKRVTLISCLTIFIVCVSISICWAITSLLPPKDREPPIVITDLLVTTDVFPPNWKIIGTPMPEPEQFELDWGEDNIFIRFQSLAGQGFATHFIFKFRNEALAKYGLFRIKQQGYLFPSTSKSPEDWKYSSPIADDWLFGCTGETLCTAIGRYDEIISVFDTSYINLQDLEIILRAIDEKIDKYLLMSN